MRPYMFHHPGSLYKPAAHKHANKISHECTSQTEKTFSLPLRLDLLQLCTPLAMNVSL